MIICAITSDGQKCTPFECLQIFLRLKECCMHSCFQICHHLQSHMRRGDTNKTSKVQDILVVITSDNLGEGHFCGAYDTLISRTH